MYSRGGFCILSFLITVALFYALVPGVLVTIPGGNASRMTNTLVHGVVFALVMWLVRKLVKQFKGHGPAPKAAMPPPAMAPPAVQAPVVSRK